ncbi:MAG: hypothetical protein KJ069_03250 [Anaerolineae bacterium]|nr:hypothetical protein [Anaerolineae bacterium]
MQNPWSDLPLEPPYVLPQEEDAISAFNASASETHQFHCELPPEPYLGNPEAEIILLNLNPGFSVHDAAFYGHEHVRHVWRKNLLHEELRFPFYMFDTAVPQYIAGPKWWSKKLKEPINLAGREAVAQKFCCIEYFPYHSRRYRGVKTILPSQKYNFRLVEKAIARRTIIILMRKEKAWLSAVPKLKGYDLLFRVNSTQNPAISENNCPDGFPLMAQILQQS